MSTWNIVCFSVYFADKGQDLNNYKKDEIEQEPLYTCFNNAVTGSLISGDHIKGQLSPYIVTLVILT